MAESVERRAAIERRESTQNIVRKKEAKIAAAGGGKTVKKEWSMVSTAAGDATNYPIEGDTVRLHYTAYIANGAGPQWMRGKAFASSHYRHQPIQFTVGKKQIIEGIEKAVVFMSQGQKCRVYIPSELAYGELGFPPLIDPNTDLVYDLELVGFSNDSLVPRPANPAPLNMDQFTHGKVDMSDLELRAEVQYEDLLDY